MKHEDIESIVKQVLLTQQDRSDKAATKSVSDLIGSLDDKIHILDENVSKRLDRLETNTKWIEDAMGGQRILSWLSKKVLHMLLVITALSGAIIWIKDWLKK